MLIQQGLNPIGPRTASASGFVMQSSAANPVVLGTGGVAEMYYNLFNGNKWMLLQWNYTQTAAPGAGGQQGTYGYRLKMPTGFQIDTSVTGFNTATGVNQSNTQGILLSSVGGGNTGDTLGIVSRAVAYDANSFRIVGMIGSAAAIWGLTNPISNNSCICQGWAIIPLA